MIKNFKLTKEFVKIQKSAADWQEAIRISSDVLLEKGYIEQSYQDAMIDSVNEYGPYIVIAPGIAMPHARPETGSIKVGFSILKLDEPVSFSESPDHQVNLFIALSCKDANTHIEILQSIITLLDTEEKQNKAKNASSVDELYDFFKGGENE